MAGRPELRWDTRPTHGPLEWGGRGGGMRVWLSYGSRTRPSPHPLCPSTAFVSAQRPRVPVAFGTTGSCLTITRP